MTLELRSCTACGTVRFPPRALCPRCGEARSTPAAPGAGRLLALTERDGVRIAEIATDAGPVVIARLEGEPGEPLELTDDGGVPVARAGW